MFDMAVNTRMTLVLDEAKKKKYTGDGWVKKYNDISRVMVHSCLLL